MSSCGHFSEKSLQFRKLWNGTSKLSDSMTGTQPAKKLLYK